MRASFTALVLATVAIAHVAAGPVRHGHAHFHQKKDAELKVEQYVEPPESQFAMTWQLLTFWCCRAVEERDVDWSKVKYTYSEGQTWGEQTAAPAPAAAAATAPAAVAAAPAAVTSAAKAATSKVAAAASAVGSTAATVATEILTAADAALLKSLGALTGQNSNSPNGAIWIGATGPYVHEFTNAASEDIILVCWGPMGSWINAVAPVLTHSIPAGQKIDVSFASGYSGACAPVYPDTKMGNGQVVEGWLEFTHDLQGVVDVSYEVNMNGRPITSVGPQCTTSPTQCVFKCKNSSTSCEFDYYLQNCQDQPGAQYGQFDGADSGGCGGMGASAKFYTTFG